MSKIMYPTTRELQIRLNALNIFDQVGVPPLVTDGLNGPKTRQALQYAMRLMKVDHARELFHPSGLLRIHWHWTGGSYAVTGFEKSHYNDVHDVNGERHAGLHPAEEQAEYSHIDDVGVSHTFMANSRAIGQAVDCMGGATENGKVCDPGDYPITWKMVDSMLKRSAFYCKKFDIPVSKWTTLSHAEIQPTLGIRQKWKWDIRVLPDDPTKLLDAVEAGDILRERLTWFLEK